MEALRELIISVYPKAKRTVYTANRRRGGLESLDTAARNIYEQVLLLKVELPEMESYPLFELSNPKVDFEEAEMKYLELSMHFNLLKTMQPIYFKKGLNCRRFLDSLCVTRINNKSYLEIIVIYPNYAIDEVRDLFNSMGIDSSSIIQ